MAGMLKWVSTNSTVYKSITPKDPDTLYFISDTKEIYKGENSHTESIVLISGNFPTTGIAKNKLYINTATFEGKTYDGSNWISVMRPVSNVLSDDDTSTDNHLITGAAIKLYVTEKLADIIAEGGVTAKTTKIAEAIEVIGTTQGAYKDGDIIKTTDSVWDVIKKMLQTRVAATYTKPTLSLSISNSSVEAGTSVSPTITPTFTQNDAGALAGYKLERTDNNGTITVVEETALTPYSQASIVVTDSNLSYKGTASYSAGAVKNDNLGDPSPAGQITSGSITATRTYTAFRRAFWGGETVQLAEGTTKPTAITASAGIRALPSKTDGAAKSGASVISVACNAGNNRVTIAYPATLPDISEIKSQGLSMSVLSVFNKTLVNVEGADGFTAISYKVYTYIPDIPFPSGDTYIVSI